MDATDEIEGTQTRWINYRALQWAYDQNGLGVTGKAVLLTFAMHANSHGYSWPGVHHIAFTWGMDRKTIRRQIEALLVRRLICRTKKRVGATGQVKVYRLPKITWGSGSKSTRLQNDQSGAKAGTKRGIRGCKFPPNNGIIEQGIKNYDKGIALGNSVPTTPAKQTPRSDFVFERHQYQKHQDQPAQNHVKWQEFTAWCRKQRDRHGQPGQPTESGFWKWLRGQKPQWRNKVRGYTLDGKFFTAEQAIRIGCENPDLLTQFRKATKTGDKIHVIDGDPPSPQLAATSADTRPIRRPVLRVVNAIIDRHRAELKE